MTATIQPTAVNPEPSSSEPLVAMPVKVVHVLIATATVALIAYGVGMQHGRAAPHVLTGRAYVGATVGSVIVDGSAYGFGITSNGMQWYDARGGAHDGGMPPCLQGRPGHNAWIRFGYSTAHGLHGDTWRSVDWVQCRTHKP